jgi:hypothetical protein
LRRSFGLDVLACPDCGGRLHLVATIADPRVIARILAHLGLPLEPPGSRPAAPAELAAGGRALSPLPTPGTGCGAAARVRPSPPWAARSPR